MRLYASEKALSMRPRFLASSAFLDSSSALVIARATVSRRMVSARSANSAASSARSASSFALIALTLVSASASICRAWPLASSIMVLMSFSAPDPLSIV